MLKALVEEVYMNKWGHFSREMDTRESKENVRNKNISNINKECFQQAHQSTQMKEESVHMNIGKLELPKLKHEGKKRVQKTEQSIRELWNNTGWSVYALLES